MTLLINTPTNLVYYRFQQSHYQKNLVMVFELYIQSDVKQHLGVTTFWGNSETSVRIQIYAAICTYCVVAIIEHKMKLERNIYEVMRILGSSLLVKEHIKDLLAPDPEPTQIANCHPTLDLEFD